MERLVTSEVGSGQQRTFKHGGLSCQRYVVDRSNGETTYGLVSGQSLVARQNRVSRVVAGR